METNPNMKTEGKTYFERPVYDTEGNVIGFNRPGEPLPDGGSLVSPRPDKDPEASAEEIRVAKEKLGVNAPTKETVTETPAPKKRGRKPKLAGELTSNLAARVPRERKPRLSKRSLILKGLDVAAKRANVLSALEAQYGKLDLKDEEKHSVAEFSYKGKNLFLKYKNITKGNPDRSLMIAIYASDFRGKKVKPLGRGYEKKGSLFISRVFDKVEAFVTK